VKHSINGLWAELSRRTQAAPVSPTTNLWSALDERSDPAQYRPHAVPDVAEEQVVEDDQTFVVLRSPGGTYLRLTLQQSELWRNMDGTRTVAQLATQAFLKYRQLLPVGDLVATLKHEGFLTDQPVGVYQAIGAALEQQTAKGWGRRVLGALAGTTWQITHIDGVYGALYRSFGWLLFTRPFLALWSLVALVGSIAFVVVLVGVRSPLLFSAAGAVPLQLAELWSALVLSFLLHESAHALAAKHYRRTIDRGGVTLFFGVPYFFVDTSDVWRSPRRARMLVSAAGPMADLFVGGLAAILVLLRPDLALNTFAYKLAFACSIATLLNLNPLLQLDGYFILVDWLRIPDLRRRALTYLRGAFWQTVGRRELQREERAYSIYGALSSLSVIVAIVVAIQLWNRLLVGTIRSLWQTGAPLQRAIAAVLFLVPSVAIVVAVSFVGYTVGRGLLAVAIRRGFGRRPALLAGGAVAVILLNAWWLLSV
jgi:putative peptide zinc metalloprotease protein